MKLDIVLVLVHLYFWNILQRLNKIQKQDVLIKLYSYKYTK